MAPAVAAVDLEEREATGGKIGRAERSALFRAALEDPAWQRDKLYRSPLYWPQVEAIKLVERHILDKTGKVLTVRSARQTMKNECSAQLQVRSYLWHQADGGTYIRTAPTWKPQIVNSKLRLEKLLKKDPLVRGVKPREGYIYEGGNVQVMFLSSDTQAEVVGATASIALDIDEAHKVDKGKFEEEFAPMVAWGSAPIVMWGVAADKQDLLYEHRIANEERDPALNLQYPAEIWCELRPEYARRYTEHRAHLGADHPVILTQYDMVDVDVIGGFLKSHHLASLFSGDHKRAEAPGAAEEIPKTYVAMTIDIAGEDEEEEADPLKKATGGRDSTTALVWLVDGNDMAHGLPKVRLATVYWWTGKAMGDKPSGLPGQQSILLQLLNIWKPRATVVDARGIGEQIAAFLKDRWVNVNAYKATDVTVSEDCYGLLAFLNNDRLKVFAEDRSPEYRELWAQAKSTRYEIRGNHQLIKLLKPLSGPTRHIDMVKAMTYLPRALGATKALNVFF